MVIKFKIFELVYQERETFSGYSHGYGKEHCSDPVLRGIRGILDQDFDTLEDAEDCLKRNGENICK